MRDLRPIRELIVSPEMAGALRQVASTLPQWALSADQARDLDLLVGGALFPLKGFVSQRDYQAIMQDWRLASGIFWPRPVTLRVDTSFFERIEEGQDIALTLAGEVRAVMSVTDRWLAPEGALLGGPVKGLHRATSGLNALRHRLRNSGATGIVALWPGLAPGAAEGRASFQLDPDGEDDCAVLLQAIIARNCGAAEMLVPECLLSDRVLAHADETGVTIRAVATSGGQDA